MRVGDNLKFYAEKALRDGYTTIVSAGKDYSIEEVLDMVGLNYNDTYKPISYRDLYNKYKDDLRGVGPDDKIDAFKKARFDTLMGKLNADRDARDEVSVERFGLGEEEVLVKAERKLFYTAGEYDIITSSIGEFSFNKFYAKAEVWDADGIVNVFVGKGCVDKAIVYTKHLGCVDSIISGVDVCFETFKGETRIIIENKYMIGEFGDELIFSNSDEAKAYVKSFTPVDENMYDPDEDEFETDEIDIDVNAVELGDVIPVVMDGFKLGIMGKCGANEVKMVSGKELSFGSNGEVEDFIRGMGFEGVMCHFS